MIRVSFVCLGNICRSPTAEAVFRHRVAEAGLDHWLAAESAGTAAYHVGDPADPRSVQAAKRRGIAVVGSARQFVSEDWARLDLVLAVDRSTLSAVQATASGSQRDRARLLRSFDPGSPAGAEVPDPYYGGEQGFEHVLDLCEAACQGLVQHLCVQHPPPDARP